MKKPMEKVAKALLSRSTPRRSLQTIRDQYVYAQANPRPVASQVEDVAVNCPYNDDNVPVNHIYLPQSPATETPTSGQCSLSLRVGSTITTPVSVSVSNKTCPSTESENLERVQPNSSSRQRGRSPVFSTWTGTEKSKTQNDAKPFSAIPSPKGSLPFFGTLFEFMKAGGMANLHEFNVRRHEELGPIYKEMTMGIDTIFIGSPALFKQAFAKEGRLPRSYKSAAQEEFGKVHHREGLFFMEGEEWQQARKAANSVLLKAAPPGVTEKVFTAYEDYLSQYLQRWGEKVDAGKEIDPYKEAISWAYDGVSYLIFGDSFKRIQNAKTTEAVFEAHKIMMHTEHQLLSLSPALARRLNLQVWKDYENFTLWFHRKVKENAEETIPDRSAVRLDPDEGLKNHGISYRLLTETDLPMHLLRSMAAGFTITIETVGITLLWYLSCVASQPDVQTQIYNEIMRACGPKTPFSFQHIDQVPTLKNALKESQRLYPIAPFTTRQVVEPTIIGGYEIPAQKWVILSNYFTQRSAEYFPDPLKFWPDRWLRQPCAPTSEDQQFRNALLGVNDVQAFASFGGGKRSCPAKVVSKHMYYLLLGKLVQNYELHASVPDTVMATIMIPKGTLDLRLKRRI